jgi:hypothetical protein
MGLFDVFNLKEVNMFRFFVILVLLAVSTGCSMTLKVDPPWPSREAPNNKLSPKDESL